MHFRKELVWISHSVEFVQFDAGKAEIQCHCDDSHEAAAASLILRFALVVKIYLLAEHVIV